MKPFLKNSLVIKLFFALAILLSFASCTNHNGYEHPGELTNPLAKKLVDSTCHFITKDLIEEYVGRYQHYKDSVNGGLSPIKNVMTDSCSFNNYIVQKILTDKNCIGLRVLYGMGPDLKLHVILVGIKPDYSTLYIEQPAEKCPGDDRRAMMMRSAPAPMSSSSSPKIGGAEMGQMP